MKRSKDRLKALVTAMETRKPSHSDELMLSNAAELVEWFEQSHTAEDCDLRHDVLDAGVALMKRQGGGNFKHLRMTLDSLYDFVKPKKESASRATPTKGK